MSRAEGNGRAISPHALQAAVFLTQKILFTLSRRG